jgi:RNA polymerase sigma-70 factor (ECF subfamily)
MQQFSGPTADSPSSERRGPSAPDDAELVARAQQGDMAAFDGLVDRYKDRLYRVVYGYLGHREDALDICQEAFVRAWRGLDGFRGDAGAYTWLYRIATNAARNRLRDRSRKGRDRGASLEALSPAARLRMESDTARPDSPRDHAEERETAAALEGCLEALPEHLRMAFVLRVYDEAAYDAIGRVLECPVGTVKSRLNEARRRLRDCLKRRGVLEP